MWTWPLARRFFTQTREYAQNLSSPKNTWGSLVVGCQAHESKYKTESRFCQHLVVKLDKLFAHNLPDPTFTQTIVPRQLGHVPSIVAVLDLAVPLTSFVNIDKLAPKLFPKVSREPINGGLVCIKMPFGEVYKRFKVIAHFHSSQTRPLAAAERSCNESSCPSVDHTDTTHH